MSVYFRSEEEDTSQRRVVKKKRNKIIYDIKTRIKLIPLLKMKMERKY